MFLTLCIVNSCRECFGKWTCYHINYCLLYTQHLLGSWELRNRKHFLKTMKISNSSACRAFGETTPPWWISVGCVWIETRCRVLSSDQVDFECINAEQP